MGEKEKWVDVIGYAGAYQISNLGRVRSIDRVVTNVLGVSRKLTGRIISPVRDNKGYWRVCLSKNGVRKPFFLHYLILTAWVGPRPDGYVCRHGHKGIDDNRVENLSWGTRLENSLDRKRDGTLLQNGVMADKPVRRGDGREFANVYKAARSTRCSVLGICKCCNGMQYRSGLYSWQFI